MKRLFWLVFLVFLLLGLVASEGQAVRPTREIVDPSQVGSPGDDDAPDKQGASPIRPWEVGGEQGEVKRLLPCQRVSLLARIRSIIHRAAANASCAVRRAP